MTSPPPSPSSAERLEQVRAELKETFIERDEVVDGLLVALLSRQHVLLLGPPGTAKSMLARQVCEGLAGARYFQWLLTKFTTPEEILGPISLPALEQGRYERVTRGKLPEAHVAFLDEAFKASSAILNALLTVLNERQFHQGDEVVDVPLLTLVAASNELPEQEEELSALYDRFLLRFVVGYIEQDFRFARLLRLRDDGPAEGATLDMESLEELWRRVDSVEIPDDVLRELIDIRRSLGAQGVIASDRRYRLATSVLRAAAVLDGRQQVAVADLGWLAHVLWSDPEERHTVREVLTKVARGHEEEAQKLLFQAREVHAYANKPWPDEESRNRAVLEAHTKLQRLRERLRAISDGASERGRATTRLTQMTEEVSALQRHLLERK